MKSILSVYDIASGVSETILTVDQHIEEPNWTPDAAALIVNGGGWLYRVPLDVPELQRIDPGFATKLNNDHGISPDGSLLVISDSSHTAGSGIYKRFHLFMKCIQRHGRSSGIRPA